MNTFTNQLEMIKKQINNVRRSIEKERLTFKEKFNILSREDVLISILGEEYILPEPNESLVPSDKKDRTFYAVKDGKVYMRIIRCAISISEGYFSLMEEEFCQSMGWAEAKKEDLDFLRDLASRKFLDPIIESLEREIRLLQIKLEQLEEKRSNIIKHDIAELNRLRNESEKRLLRPGEVDKIREIESNLSWAEIPFERWEQPHVNRCFHGFVECHESIEESILNKVLQDLGGHLPVPYSSIEEEIRWEQDGVTFQITLVEGGFEILSKGDIQIGQFAKQRLSEWGVYEES